jgi:cell division protein ZapA
MSGLPNIRVQIFGSEYRIASDADPEHIREVARYIDQKMREVANALSLRSISTIAVLTAVNLADELFKSREEGQEIDQLAREKANQLADSTRIT